jgi:hypothetical protein
MIKSILLTADAIINLLLGILLIIFSPEIVSALGVPVSDSAFYPNILGAVLFGIGIALLIERFKGSSGLGLLGAVSINICGGIVLAAWLVHGSLEIPLYGKIFLWSLVLLLVGISSLELLTPFWKRRE